MDINRVSRKHFCIQYDEGSGHFTLTCVSGRTMTVNGRVLNEDDSVVLNNLDTLSIGGVNFVFRDDIHAGGGGVVRAPEQRPPRPSIRPTQPRPQIQQQPMGSDPIMPALEGDDGGGGAEQYTSVRAKLDLGLDDLELDAELDDGMFVTADDSQMQNAMTSTMMSTMGSMGTSSMMATPMVMPMMSDDVMMMPMPSPPQPAPEQQAAMQLAQQGYFLPPMPMA